MYGTFNQPFELCVSFAMTSENTEGVSAFRGEYTLECGCQCECGRKDAVCAWVRMGVRVFANLASMLLPEDLKVLVKVK